MVVVDLVAAIVLTAWVPNSIEGFIFTAGGLGGLVLLLVVVAGVLLLVATLLAPEDGNDCIISGIVPVGFFAPTGLGGFLLPAG